MSLAFDVYTSFSQVLGKKVQYESDFLPQRKASVMECYFSKVAN